MSNFILIYITEIYNIFVQYSMDVVLSQWYGLQTNIDLTNLWQLAGLIITGHSHEGQPMHISQGFGSVITI